MFKTATILALAALTAYPSQLRAEDVGYWKINYFPTKAPYNGCAMLGSYRDGTQFGIVVTKVYEWGIYLENANWKMRKDASINFSASVDGRFVTSGVAKVWSSTSAILPLQGADTFKALQYGNGLVIQTPGSKLTFQLTDTAKAMDAALRCVGSLNPKAPQQDARRDTKDFRLLSQAETTVMLTNLLNSAGVIGYKIDPPEPNSTLAKYSLSNGTKGWLIASQGKDTATADNYTGSAMSSLTTLCKGELVSGKKSIPTSDGSVVRQIIAFCKTDNLTMNITTTIVRSPDGLLVELTVFTPDGAKRQETPPSDGGSSNTVLKNAIGIAFRP